MNDDNPFQSPAANLTTPADLPMPLATRVGYVLVLVAGIGSCMATLSGMNEMIEHPSWGFFGVTLGFAAATAFCYRVAVRIRRHRSYLRKRE